MGTYFSPSHVALLFGIVFGGLFLIPSIFYISTLQRTLSRCAPESRALKPSLLWLYFVPFFNFIFHFFIVTGMAKSLRNEFEKRGLALSEAAPGQSFGIPMCVCACFIFVPLLGVLAGIAFIVLWVAYWEKMSEYLHELDNESHAGLAAPAV